MLEPIDFVILIALEEEAVAFRDIFEDDFDNWQGEYPARLTITRQRWKLSDRVSQLF